MGRKFVPLGQKSVYGDGHNMVDGGAKCRCVVNRCAWPWIRCVWLFWDMCIGDWHKIVRLEYVYSEEVVQHCDQELAHLFR